MLSLEESTHDNEARLTQTQARFVNVFENTASIKCFNSKRKSSIISLFGQSEIVDTAGRCTASSASPIRAIQLLTGGHEEGKLARIQILP